MGAGIDRQQRPAHWAWRPLVALLILAVTAAHADVRNVAVNSEPGAASVYLLKGFKRVKIGETPLKHVFAVQSPQSIVRLEIVKPGYESKRIEIGEGQDRVSTRLTSISPFREAGSYTDDVLRAMAASLERQSAEAWRDALVALEPWGPETPAYLQRRDGSVFLVADLGNTGAKREGRDTSVLAARFAAAFDGGGPLDSVAGVILSFSTTQAGGVQSTVGTRLETDMVCEGGMVMSSVWDNCATRSATTSSSSYGSSIRYQCVGGTVTRQVYNPCARRVPKQRAVVDIRNTPQTAINLNAHNVVVDAAARKVLGSCRYVNGVREQIDRADDVRLQRACPASAQIIQ